MARSIRPKMPVAPNIDGNTEYTRPAKKWAVLPELTNPENLMPRGFMFSVKSVSSWSFAERVDPTKID